MVLENTEHNPEEDAKSLSNNKSKGTDEREKMESIDSQIPKMAKMCWTEKHCVLHKKGLVSMYTA